MAAATWSNKKPACVITWGTLAVLGESTRSFPNSGSITMKQMTFWVGSAELRSVRARRLAVQIDLTFRNMLRSRFEKNVTKTKSIPAMTDELLDGEATMADFAKLTDSLYEFLGEE